MRVAIVMLIALLSLAAVLLAFVPPGGRASLLDSGPFRRAAATVAGLLAAAGETQPTASTAIAPGGYADTGSPPAQQGPRAYLASPIAGGQSAGFALLPGAERADEPLPVQLNLVDDAVDAQGTWVQTFRVTIEPGAALFYVALALFDDPGRVEEIFELVRQQAPEVTSPSLVRAGLSFLVPVDAARTHVLGQSSSAPDGTKTRVYYNGVRETFYPAGHSVMHAVEFPPVQQIDNFSFDTDAGARQVPAGAKLVEYQYLPEDDFPTALEQIYGVASVPALQDFTRQTGWDFNARLPQPGEKHLLVFSTIQSYQDEPVPPSPWIVDDPAAKEKMAQVSAARERVGVRLSTVEPAALVYRVGVMVPDLTAKELARLLYGSEDGYLRLAELASIRPPQGTPSPRQGTADAASKPPADFDPRLFGRVFEVRVDLASENFPWQESTAALDGRRTVTLLNGTTVEDYGPSLVRHAGIQRVVNYPSGYRKVVYQPQGMTMTLLDALVFAYQIFGGNSASVSPDDVRLDAKLRLLQQERLKQLPKVLWDWDPGAPRQTGDIAASVGWYGEVPGQLIEVLLRPRSEVKPVEAFWQGRFYVKILPVAALAGVAFVFVFAILFGRRRRWRAPV